MDPAIKRLLTEAATTAGFDRNDVNRLVRSANAVLSNKPLTPVKPGRPGLSPDAETLLSPLRGEINSLSILLAGPLRAQDPEACAYFTRYAQLLRELRDTINLYVMGSRALPLEAAIEERLANGQPAGTHWTDWLSDKVKAKVQASYEALMLTPTPAGRTRKRTRQPFTDPFSRPRNVHRWDAFLARTRKRITDMEQNLHYEPALKTPEGHDAATDLLELYRTVYARAKDRRDGKHRTAPGQPLPAAPVSMHALLDAEERAALDNALARLDVARGIHHEKGDTDEAVAD